MSEYPSYLIHHGIPNQKWGVRRFQYEDGSWTPEGRERYGEGGAREKSDVQKYKAKVSYKTQKYKEDLKLKAQKEKDARIAKAEKNRIKLNAKNVRLARKEQGKIDRLNKKEEAKINTKVNDGFKSKSTKKMSDDDLQTAIDRLKLQAEYNKQYVLATQPNSALAKADRFFAGPTGKAVVDISTAVLPNVAQSATQKILESGLKYANPEDRKTKQLEIKKAKQDVKAEKAKNDAAVKKAEADAAYRRQEVLEKQLKNIPVGYEWVLDSSTGKLRLKKKP